MVALESAPAAEAGDGDLETMMWIGVLVGGSPLTS